MGSALFPAGLDPAEKRQVRVKALIQQSLAMLSFGNPKGQILRVRVTTAIPEESVPFDPVTAEADPENADKGPVFDAPVEIIQVSGDTEAQFIEALKRLGVITPLTGSGEKFPKNGGEA